MPQLAWVLTTEIRECNCQQLERVLSKRDLIRFVVAFAPLNGQIHNANSNNTVDKSNIHNVTSNNTLDSLLSHHHQQLPPLLRQQLLHLFHLLHRSNSPLKLSPNENGENPLSQPRGLQHNIPLNTFSWLGDSTPSSVMLNSGSLNRARISKPHTSNHIPFSKLQPSFSK